LRAGTSVGANYRAVCRARSDREFIAKPGLTVEEADESSYWLEILVEAEPVRPPTAAKLQREANELTRIFVASRETVRNRLKSIREPTGRFRRVSNDAKESPITNHQSPIANRKSQITNHKSQMEGLPGRPFRRRLNRGLGGPARIGSSAAGEAADGANRHLVIADNLAGQAHARETFLCEPGLFSNRHSIRFAADELNAAGCAAGIAAAGMQDVHAGILFNRKHEALAIFNVNGSKAFHGQHRHAAMLT
jgi:four helix bundle protein